MIEHFSAKDIDAIEGDPFNNYFTHILSEVLGQIEEPKNVCDVGCGNGVFSAALKKHGLLPPSLYFLKIFLQFLITFINDLRSIQPF